MNEQFVQVQIDVETAFEGADVFLSDGSTRRVTKNNLDAVRFLDVGRGAQFTTRQMLGIFLAKKGMELRDFIETETLNAAIVKGKAKDKPPLEIRVRNSDFKFKAKGKWVSFYRVLFDVEFTFQPRQAS